jgi:hypothetical protein
MTNDGGPVRGGQPRRSSAAGSFARAIHVRGDLAACLLGLLWALGLLAAIWVAPLMTVDTGRAGAQPRISIAAYGYTLGFVAFTVPAVAAVLVIGLVAASGSATGRRRRTLAKAGVTVSAALLATAVVGFATIIIGIYVLPAAVALLVGSNLALQASGAPRDVTRGG